MKPTQIECSKGSFNQIPAETTVHGDIRRERTELSFLRPIEKETKDWPFEKERLLESEATHLKNLVLNPQYEAGSYSIRDMYVSLPAGRTGHGWERSLAAGRPVHGVSDLNKDGMALNRVYGPHTLLGNIGNIIRYIAWPRFSDKLGLRELGDLFG